MDTNEQIVARPMDGRVLLSKLKSLRLSNPGSNAVFDTRDGAVMNEAIYLLRRAGYVLAELNMIEGDCYIVRFIPNLAVYPDFDHWPYWIKLRYLVDGVIPPPLALAGRSDKGLERYEGSYRYTYGSNASDGEKMVLHFKHDHPGVEPVWVPLFDGKPALF